MPCFRASAKAIEKQAAAVGVIAGANRLIRIPSNPLAGALFDRFGRRRLFLLGMGLGVASTLGYGLLRRPALSGDAYPVGHCLDPDPAIGGITMIHDISTPQNRGRLAGAYNAWMLAAVRHRPSAQRFPGRQYWFPGHDAPLCCTGSGGLAAALAHPKRTSRVAHHHAIASILAGLRTPDSQRSASVPRHPG